MSLFVHNISILILDPILKVLFVIILKNEEDYFLLRLVELFIDIFFRVLRGLYVEFICIIFGGKELNLLIGVECYLIFLLK